MENRGSDARVKTNKAGLSATLHPLPPEHPFQSRAVRIGPRDPIRHQFQMGREATANLLPCRAKWRAIFIGNEIMNREKLAVGFEPAQYRPQIVLSSVRIDRTIERVFKKPVKLLRRRVLQEI